MASTLELRRRIRSVKNTAQITRAMQMVAASKMRKAQAAALAGRSYQEVLQRVLASLRGKVDSQSNPLLQEREVKHDLFIVITSDKGLCGPLNANVLREVAGVEAIQPKFVATGRKGVQFLARTKRDLLADFPVSEHPAFKEIRPLVRLITEKYLAGEIDRVRIVYARFINTLVQEPTVATLLPIQPANLLGKESEELSQPGGEALFEPSETEVLAGILPHYLGFQIYQMLLNARASEHSARMVAMKNATDNAKELVKDLSLEYNKVRQASITTEILEIATAQMSSQ